MTELEHRVNPMAFEVREESDGMHFSGYAALFNSLSLPMPFIETVAPGAFKRTLKARNDIKFLWNHDPSEILGSTRAKTLTLSEDVRGLKVDGVLPNTQRGRDVAELISRGDVDAMSWGFTIPPNGATWSKDGNERVINHASLHEVSIVAWPAYPETAGTISIRKFEKTAERADVTIDELVEALLKIEEGLDLTPDEQETLGRVISKLAPETDTEPDTEPEPDAETEPEPDAEPDAETEPDAEPETEPGAEVSGSMLMLELKKKKLALLEKGI